MSRNRKIKRVAGVALAACMTVSSVTVQNFGFLGTDQGAGTITAYAGEQAEALTTLWQSSEIGTHTDVGSYQYNSTDKTVTVTGAGTKFDKDSGIDDLFYAYLSAKGDITVTAKMVVSGSGQAGILIKNTADESTSAAASLYADISKSQIRYGYHNESKGGGASSVNTAVTPTSQDIYLKIEISGTTATYYVASQADFSDAKIKTQTIADLDAKTVGFFATAGTTATFSDVQISSTTTSDSVTTTKILFDSETGELTPEDSTSKDYSGDYDAGNSYSTVVDGNELNITQVRSSTVKGSIRTDTGINYWLFPATTQDMTISADVTVTSLDSGTDKQGIAMGQFSASLGTAVMNDVLHIQKNMVLQHSYSTGLKAGGTGQPNASGIVLGKTYTLTYTKSGNTAIMSAVSADGTVLFENQTYDLRQDDASLQTGQSVRYGFAFSGVTATIANVTLTNSAGNVVYDMNDYYVAVGVAPVISNATAAVSDDRTQINVNWDLASEGTGNVKYAVYASKDGGEYTKVGESKVNSYSYAAMDGDGSYTFKVVPYGGDTAGIESLTAAVAYQAPLSQATLTAVGTSKSATLTWTEVAGATSYDIYKKLGSDGTYTIVSNTTELTYIDTDVESEEPYYYYIVAKNQTNVSNPSEETQVLTSDGHSGTYVYEDEATEITVVSKSNDTVFSNTANLTLQADEAGTAELYVNDTLTQTKIVSANKEFSFDMDLVQGRNDITVLFTDASGNITRTIYNFVSNPGIDIVVDAAYTGTDGTITDGYPTYSTVQKAVESVAADNTESKVIFIKNGEYNERVTVTSPYVSLLGEDSQKTHIAYTVCIANGNADSMWNRNVMYVDSTATGFTAENLSIENTYDYTNGNDQQADALCIVADQTACVNIRLIGYQDTLLTDSRLKDASGNYAVTRQYFAKCYITGNVDFIYGAGTSVFEDCDIVARYTSYKSDGCFTAGRTYATTQYGYVFNNCRFLAEDGVGTGQFRMARPWGADDSTTFINCYLGRAISTTTSYGDMSGNLAENARFAEYGSYGPGYVVSNTRPLLTSLQAKSYATSTVLGDYAYATVLAALYQVDQEGTGDGGTTDGGTTDGGTTDGGTTDGGTTDDGTTDGSTTDGTTTDGSTTNGSTTTDSTTTDNTSSNEESSVSSEESAQTATDTSVKTGDMSPIDLFAGVAATSAMVAALMKRKKETDTE